MLDVEGWQSKARRIRSGRKLKTTCVYFTCSRGTPALPGRDLPATCESAAEGDLELLSTHNPQGVGCRAALWLLSPCWTD